MFLNVYHEWLKEIVFVWFFVGILLSGRTPSSDINLSSQWAKHWGLLSPQFLGGLSLHLNHLIASCMANYDWPFGTLLFGLF